VNALCACFVLIQFLTEVSEQHIDLPEDGFVLWFGSRDCQSIPHKYHKKFVK
jgi:hypothetical protein